MSGGLCDALLPSILSYWLLTPTPPKLCRWSWTVRSFWSYADSSPREKWVLFFGREGLPLFLLTEIARFINVLKSTFAEHLQHFFPHFRRCNQDDLGSRHYVERLARESLNGGFSVCIDRTNFDIAWVTLKTVTGRILTRDENRQRSHWIRIAREFPEIAIWVIVFDTPIPGHLLICFAWLVLIWWILFKGAAQ